MGSRGEALEVVLTWGGNPQLAELYDGPRTVRVGEEDGAAFALPREIVGDGFALLEADGDAWMMCIPANAIARAGRKHPNGAVDVVDIDAIAPDARGDRRLRIDRDVVAVMSIGDFTFHVRPSEAQPKRVAPPPGIDWRAYRWVAASAAFHALFLGLFMMSPPDAAAISLDDDQARANYLRYHLAAIERQEETNDSHLRGDEGAGEASGGREAPGEEGAAGAQDEQRNTGGGVRVRGRAADDRVPLTADTVRRLSTLGMIAAAARIDGPHSPYGAADAEGWSEESAWGPLTAPNFGFGPGSGGFDMRGTGRGAGCRPGQDCGAGAIAVGEFGTGWGTTCSTEEFRSIERSQGRAAAVDHCSGGDMGRGQIAGTGPRRARVPTLRPGTPTTVGGLSKEQVRRVVRLNISQVRFCYEQELNARPDLAGRVAVQFIIKPEGDVQSTQVAQSSLRSSEVEQCVTTAVRRWSFPQSPGITVVTYPFQFEPAG